MQSNTTHSLPKLDTKHVAWILEAAAEKFEEHARNAELAILRHQTFTDPIATAHSAFNQDRVKEVERQRQNLAQYQEILAKLRALRDHVSEVSAQEFAAAFKASSNPQAEGNS